MQIMSYSQCQYVCKYLCASHSCILTVKENQLRFYYE